MFVTIIVSRLNERVGVVAYFAELTIGNAWVIDGDV